MAVTIEDIIAHRRMMLKACLPDLEYAQFLAGIIVGLRILLGEIQVQLKPSKMK